MADLDVDALLTPVSASAPCGENLEYDGQFAEFERALAGKPEVQYGATLVAAEPPDWKAAQSLALALFERTRDLRIAVPLARALLHTGGLDGFAAGLRLIAGLLQTHWDTLHPQLDPDDDNDPTMRVNALVALSDANGTLKALREAVLVSSRAHGRFSLRDVELSNEDVPLPAGATRPVAATIDAAFMEAELPALQAAADAAARAAELATLIENTLQAQVGAARAIDLAPLRSLLQRIRSTLEERIGRRPDAVAAAGAGADPAGAAPSTAPGSVRVTVAGEIASREDVVRMLDRLCEYYRLNEPSSPVPLMLKRARRMVPMGFHEIIAELAPDGLSQVEKILGVSGSDSAS